MGGAWDSTRKRKAIMNSVPGRENDQRGACEAPPRTTA
jgi:hypothetical protein